MLAKTFRDIQAWQLAHKLVVAVYRLTANFPKSEIFGLTSQLRRAAVSVALTIAEGFKRKSRADRLHFYNMAETSLEEVKCGLLIAKDLQYCDEAAYRDIMAIAEECGRVLHGWIVKN